MTSTWLYGEAGDRWPIQSGDVWRVGPHLLACGDVECNSAAEVLVLAGLPALVYTDPPWTPSLATGFRTKAGDPRRVDFKRLLSCAMDALSVVRGPVLVEMGGQSVDLLVQLAEERGAELVGKWPITYYKTRPGWLVQLGWSEGAAPVADFAGRDDGSTPSLAVSACTSSGDLVFDPFTGRGLTCQAAYEQGRRFAGLELHPRRLAVVVDWLAQQGLQPERVGRLTTMTGGHRVE